MASAPAAHHEGSNVFLVSCVSMNAWTNLASPQKFMCVELIVALSVEWEGISGRAGWKKCATVFRSDHASVDGCMDGGIHVRREREIWPITDSSLNPNLRFSITGDLVKLSDQLSTWAGTSVSREEYAEASTRWKLANAWLVFVRRTNLLDIIRSAWWFLAGTVWPLVAFLEKIDLRRSLHSAILLRYY